MTVQLLPAMASSASAVSVSGSASVYSNSEESLHPSVASDLFDGELSADELNEIPALPEIMESGVEMTYDFDPDMVNCLLDESTVSHPATQMALTASALDGALGFEFLPITTTEAPSLAASVTLGVPQEVPILPAVSIANTENNKATSKSKKRTTSKKTGGPTKKRKVSKANKQGSPVLGPKVGPAGLPTLISPSSSGPADRKMTITPPPFASMPVFPIVSGNTKPLLPKPFAVVSAATPPSAPTSAPELEEEASATGSDMEPESPSSNDKPLVVPDGPANISSEHIAMLTSENGPIECAKAIVATSTGTDGRRVSKSHLSQEERAQASRDRNREHARNTRLRKKAYVEELKKTLTALCAQRDANALEERRKTKLQDQHRNVRFSVLQEFLRLRGTNSTDMDRWSAILVPGFTMRLPTISAQGQAADKILTGVSQVMDDSSAFFGFLQTIGSGASTTVNLQYSMDRSDLFMDGSNAVLEWDASTVGAVTKGAQSEVTFRGNIKAQFDPESNKIVSASMLFDSGVVLAQQKSLVSN